MNRLAHASCLAVMFTSLSCAHTHSATDQPEPSAESDESPKEHASKRPNTKNTEQRSDAQEGSGTRDQAALPLATSPAGLLKPGAAEAIQKALRERGYLSSGEASGKLDGATENALRSFQDDNHLPATGMPDDLTIRKLGLQVNDVFKAAPSE